MPSVPDSKSLLPAAGRGVEVVAVVPARALSWQRVQLPQGVPLGAGQQTPRLRSVLEGLLEDQLLDDPAQLHFALEPGARAGEPVWVAVCDRAWLREHLQALEAAGRRVARVVPEFAPGPTASGQPELCALGTPEEAYVVLTGHGAEQGVAVLPLTPMALTLARTGLPAADAGDDQALMVRAEPAVAALAERTLGQQGQRIALHTTSQRALDAARGDWDLAQFDLSSTSSTRAPQRPLAQLVDVVSGESHSITSAQVTIGRERSVSDIALRDPNVSRRHAQLTFTGSDWSIEDLNSTNGTLVNNRRITRCPLRNGDLLTFGLSTFEFRG